MLLFGAVPDFDRDRHARMAPQPARDGYAATEIERLSRAVVPGAGSLEIQTLGAGLISETYRVVARRRRTTH